jgi:hypothetical protein
VGHIGQSAPPQSTPVSLPFLVPSLHVGPPPPLPDDEVVAALVLDVDDADDVDDVDDEDPLDDAVDDVVVEDPLDDAVDDAPPPPAEEDDALPPAPPVPRGWPSSRPSSA